MTSREIAETIGTIMIERISPPMKRFGPATGAPTSGRNENVSLSQVSTGRIFGMRTYTPQSP